jgi:uncharacterized SAM-binding protein YcdF (DUF218 family)
LALLAILLLSAALFSAQILTFAAGLLIQTGSPLKAEAILVLGGDSFGDRTLKAAELARAGYAPVVLISGPPSLVSFESSAELQYAVQHGYPAEMFREVHLPREAESTRTEARFLGQYLRAQGIKNIVIVTSNYHTRRAARLWREESPWIQCVFVGSVDPARNFTPETWWKTRPGQKVFAYEWMKTIAVTLGI